jgi:hypothetical protein
VCVDVLARSMCALSIVYVLSLDVAYVFPFIASQERARITFVVKRCKWERMKEKNKKKKWPQVWPSSSLSGGNSFLVAQRCNRR